MPSVFQPVPVTNTIMAYKTFDGQQMPALQVQKVRGMETHRTVQSVELNGVLPKGIFDLPEEIKALVQERAALEAHEVDSDSSPESEDGADTPSSENNA